MASRWDTGRIESFSDGVFAFAITLLVLDINVGHSDLPHLWHALGHQWPSYLGYVTSFLTVGGIWLVHHTIFQYARYADRQVMVTNLVLLMTIAFLPFPTRLVAQAIRTPGAEHVAVIFYGAWLLVIAGVLSVLWRTFANNRSLLKPDVGEQQIKAITRITTPNLGFYVAVIVLGFIAPTVAAFGYLTIAIVALARARGDRVPLAEPRRL